MNSYGGHEFKELRESLGISADEIKRSLKPAFNRCAIFKAGLGSGASGSFFFHSHDKKFIIKTITNSEKQFLLGTFLKAYFNYMKSNKSSYIAKLFGMYTITRKNQCPVSLILMENTLKFSPQIFDMKYIFDLKGSTVDRHTKIKSYDGDECCKKTLKDLNFIHLFKKNKFMRYSLFDRGHILSNIKKDS